MTVQNFHLGERLRKSGRPIDSTIWTSDLVRASDTAKEIVTQLVRYVSSSSYGMLVSSSSKMATELAREREPGGVEFVVQEDRILGLF